MVGEVECYGVIGSGRRSLEVTGKDFIVQPQSHEQLDHGVIENKGRKPLARRLVRALPIPKLDPVITVVGIIRTSSSGKPQ